jgi:hypothetical protein
VGLLTPAGEQVVGDFTGDAPVDAIFRAINAATVAAIGPDLFDPGRRAAVEATGFAQGRRVATAPR